MAATTAKEKDVVLKSFKALLSAKLIGKNDFLIIPLDMLEEEEGFNQRDYNDPEVVAHIESLATAYQAVNFVPPSHRSHVQANWPNLDG